MGKKIVLKLALPRERNPLVKELFTALYRKRIEVKLKGKGSYNRNRRTDCRSGDYLLWPIITSI